MELTQKTRKLVDSKHLAASRLRKLTENELKEWLAAVEILEVEHCKHVSEIDDSDNEYIIEELAIMENCGNV